MCVQDGDIISIYEINQTFNNDESLWNIKRLDLTVWRLSEESLKKENKSHIFQKKKN